MPIVIRLRPRAKPRDLRWFGTCALESALARTDHARLTHGLAHED